MHSEKAMGLPHEIRPQDALCAIFMLTRSSGPVTERDLMTCFGIDRAEVDAALAPLRAQGLLLDDAPRLTFAGLTAAVSLLPTCLWDGSDLDQKRRAAA